MGLLMYNQLTTQRIRSIDTFRGITILVMIFVNDVAGVSGIPAWMKHMPADADAMTFVDIVSTFGIYHKYSQHQQPQCSPQYMSLQLPKAISFGQPVVDSKR